jgi:hypothetical protein
MAGNVSEWVSDWYSSDTYSSQSLSTSLSGLDGGTDRVVRGGSWNSNNNSVRSSFRRAENPIEPFDDVGFRCAMDANQETIAPVPENFHRDRLLFQEDFDGNSNQWPTGNDTKGTFYMEKGEYHVIGSNDRNEWNWLSPVEMPEQVASDYYLEIKARFIGGTQQDDTYGILFNSLNGKGPYVLMIGIAQQSYSLQLSDSVLLTWTYSPKITQNGTNTIGVLCQDNQITIYINNNKIDGIRSDYCSPGGIGLDYGSKEHTAFDYFYIWSISK